MVRSLDEPGFERLQDADGEDGELGGSGNGDALRKDGGGVVGDAVEQAVIDAEENAHGWAGVGVEQRDELAGAAVEGLSVEFESAKESELVGMPGCLPAARARMRSGVTAYSRSISAGK